MLQVQAADNPNFFFLSVAGVGVGETPPAEGGLGLTSTPASSIPLLGTEMRRPQASTSSVDRLELPACFARLLAHHVRTHLLQILPICP